MSTRELLLIPGPTPVADHIQAVIASQPMAHRSPDFSKILKQVVADLKWLGNTDNDCFVFTASGTGAMEAAIANTINRGDKVLCLTGGVFGERWAKIAQAYGADIEKLSFAPGTALPIDKLKEKLANDHNKSIKAVTITHNETSTGVINDLQSICALVREHGALSIVDAVTSFGASPVEIDKWNIDLLITGSQKALMLPPGLSFIFVSKKAWQAYDQCQNPRFYYDLAKYRKSLEADTTPFTPAVNLIMGLQASLNDLKAAGKEAVYARHLHLKELLRQGVKDLGLKLFASETDASPTVTSILPPDGFTVDQIRKALNSQYSIRTADGQEELKGKIFRISHMGYVSAKDMLTVLAALRAVLRPQG
jgi:aspartate aminotransferase-like enzyme